MPRRARSTAYPTSRTSPRTIRWCRSRSTTSTRACASRCCGSISRRDFTGVIFRPATVCGYAPRQRLDLSVNILTNHAVNNGKITVFGGSQLRPNLHVQDYCDAVELLLDRARREDRRTRPSTSAFRTCRIMEIAELVQRVVERGDSREGAIDIVTTPTDDIRSYHINSDKIKRVLGFTAEHTIEDAVATSARRSARASCPTAWTTTATSTSVAEAAARRHEQRQARCGRHRRRRLHRQPHGRCCCSSAASRSASSTIWSAGIAAISRIIEGNPDRRAATGSDIRELEPGHRRSSPARRYVFHFAGIGDIVPVDRAADRVHGRPTSRAPCGCWNARAQARRREARLCGLVVLLRAGRDADARRPSRSTRNIPMRCRNIRASRRSFTGTRSMACRSTRSASSTPMARACARPAPMARCSACSSGRSSPASPITVVGDGTQRRDFIYVTDVAAGVSGRGRDAISRRAFQRRAPAIRSRSTGWSSCSAARSSTFPKRPGEPDCTWADIAKITARTRLEAGRSRSRKACAGCWPTSTTGATPRCGIPTVDRAGDQDLVSISRQAERLRPVMLELL